MTTLNDLYRDLKPDVEAVAVPLFESSERLLRELGNFLPHGVLLTESGEVRHVSAVPDAATDQTSSIEVLPVLHNGLRQAARESSVRAVGVAENVTVTPEGGRPTKAIKVLLEHRQGLNVALYRPFKRRFFRGYSFGNPFSVLVQPEINAWR